MILPRQQRVSMKHFPLNCRHISSGVLAQHFIQEKASSRQCLLRELRGQPDLNSKMEGNFKLLHIHKWLVSCELIQLFLNVSPKLQLKILFVQVKFTSAGIVRRTVQ